MKHDLIFNPWRRGSEPFIDMDVRSQQWKRVKDIEGDKKYSLVYADSTDLPHVPNKTEAVYIMGGHCSRGFSYVFWKRKRGKEHRMTFEEYFQSFRGIFDTKINFNVKVYSCWSAQGTPKEDPFALRFGRLMREKGYKSCPIWGYTKRIEQWYTGGQAGKEIKKLEKRLYPELDSEKAALFAQTGTAFTSMWVAIEEALVRIEV
ncbi:MAG: hypothetical protein MJE77_26855 [Proteobacteria bacterium]|nr:hypothetical protein [Pseudomonadota bacterium]